MKAFWPSCVRFKIAAALFSQMFLFHSSSALCAREPVCGGMACTLEAPSAMRNGLSGSVGVGRAAIVVPPCMQCCKTVKWPGKRSKSLTIKLVSQKQAVEGVFN